MKISKGKRWLNQGVAWLNLMVLVTGITVGLSGCGGGGGAADKLTDKLLNQTPDSFELTAQTDVALDSWIESNEVTISGIEGVVAVSVSGGEYAVAGGAYTSSAGSVSNGQTLKVRLMSSSSYNETTTANIKVGKLEKSFSVTTELDQMPDAFAFTAQTEAELSSQVESNEVTIAGIAVAVDISVSAGGEYSIDGAAYTSAAGTISEGQKVKVRLTTGSSYSETTTITLTVGAGEGAFSVTTMPDRIPDDFEFTAQNDVMFSTEVTSNEVTISGIEVAVDISVSGGEYSIDGGAFTSAAGTIENGQKVRVKVMSGSSLNETTTATLTVSTLSRDFSVTTHSADASGLFDGSGTVNGGTNLPDTKAIIYQDRFMIINETENVLYDGQIQSYNNTEFTATVAVYKDGVNSLQVDATGTITNQSTVSLVLGGTGYGSGTINLAFNVLFERDATMERFVAAGLDSWAGLTSTVNQGQDIVLQALNDSEFMGGPNGTNECDYKSGIKEIPDPTFNLFTIGFDSTNGFVTETCDHIGEGYTGFVTIIDGGTRGTDGIMWFMATNGTNSTFSVLSFYTFVPTR
ncbi:hypothetical protein [Aliikangiella sp. IMCC44359]|uniref:hypothetical protein n=1 Tax=Aliikangiella sp. IMCC44359 TaxID=3459125 RepID=UPI00403AD234